MYIFESNASLFHAGSTSSFGHHPPTVQNPSSSPLPWRMSVSQIVWLNRGVSRFWVAPCLFWEFYFSHRIASQRLHRSGVVFCTKTPERKSILCLPLRLQLSLLIRIAPKRLDDRRDLCLSLGRWLLFVIFKERRKPAVSPNLELPTG